VARDLRLTVYNRETIKRLAALARRTHRDVRLHLKVETGTWRQGVVPKDLGTFVRDVQSSPGLVIEGLSSHFANIEDTTKHDYPRLQLDCYRTACRELEAGGLRVPIKHMSCTASTILFQEPDFNLARVGIGLYGLWPSKETYLSSALEKKEPPDLKPVLSWRARIAQIKKVPAGAFIGYGCTYRTTRPTVLAVIPSAIPTATTAVSRTPPTSWSRAAGPPCGGAWPWISSWPTSPTSPASSSRTRRPFSARTAGSGSPPRTWPLWPGPSATRSWPASTRSSPRRRLKGHVPPVRVPAEEIEKNTTNSVVFIV